jgi:hypothetical protein
MHSHQGQYILYYINHQSINPLTSINDKSIGINDNMIQQCMPFGLINAGETFQRAMDIAFRGLINKCVVVYLDDVTVYSKNIEDHIQHLT